MEELKDFYRFLMARKKYWLAPILITLFLLGFLLFATSGTAIAPFVYTLF